MRLKLLSESRRVDELVGVFPECVFKVIQYRDQKISFTDWGGLPDFRDVFASSDDQNDPFASVSDEYSPEDEARDIILAYLPSDHWFAEMYGLDGMMSKKLLGEFSLLAFVELDGLEIDTTEVPSVLQFSEGECMQVAKVILRRACGG